MSDQHDESNPYASGSMHTGAASPPRDWDRPMPGERNTNMLGVVGLILSLSCCLSPIGLIVSLFALARPQRGLAIAGVVVGVLGTIVLGVALLTGLSIQSQGQGIAAAMSTQADALVIDEQVRRYESEEGGLPGSLRDVHLPLTAFDDAWGNEYRYEVSGTDWDVISAGPDGVFDTDDDFAIRGLANGSADPSLLMSWQEAAEAGAAPVVGFVEAGMETAEHQRWLTQNANRPAAVDAAPDAPPAP